MTDFISTIWRWIFNRSPQNAVKPNVQSNPIEDFDLNKIPAGARPIETVLNNEYMVGSPIGIISAQSAMKGTDGQLLRIQNQPSVLLGCGHLVGQMQQADDGKRYPIGKCYYCDLENQQLLQKGKISVFDAERLSLVCSECGKITSSGQLCCPKHYVALTDPDGTTSYLSQEQVIEEKKNSIVRSVLGSLAMLLGEDVQEQPQANQEEHRNA